MLLDSPWLRGSGDARWLEIRAADPVTVRQRLVDAGLPTIIYLGNEYLFLPGGQVIRVVKGDF